MEIICTIIFLLTLLLLAIGYFWFMAWACAKMAKLSDLNTTVAAIMGVVFGIYAIVIYFILYFVTSNENKKLNKENNNV